MLVLESVCVIVIVWCRSLFEGLRFKRVLKLLSRIKRQYDMWESFVVLPKEQTPSGVNMFDAMPKGDLGC